MNKYFKQLRLYKQINTLQYNILYNDQMFPHRTVNSFQKYNYDYPVAHLAMNTNYFMYINF